MLDTLVQTPYPHDTCLLFTSLSVGCFSRISIQSFMIHCLILPLFLLLPMIQNVSINDNLDVEPGLLFSVSSGSTIY